MSILGLTIDYGPYGFLDRYDPDHIFNGSGIFKLRFVGILCANTGGTLLVSINFYKLLLTLKKRQWWTLYVQKSGGYLRVELPEASRSDQ
jgi:hypothetical protein